MIILLYKSIPRIVFSTDPTTSGYGKGENDKFWSTLSKEQTCEEYHRGKRSLVHTNTSYQRHALKVLEMDREKAILVDNVS